MTTIYVNGQLVAKEDLSKYEIRLETVKQIFREVLRRKHQDDSCFVSLMSNDLKESSDV